MVNEEEENMRIGKYVIDPVLFEKGFSKGCGPLACESICCSTGVFADLKEKKLILSHKETVKKYMDETQTTDDSQWFDSEVCDDNDYPSGKKVGTEVFNDKCVFLNKSGMCSLQLAGGESQNASPTGQAQQMTGLKDDTSGLPESRLMTPARSRSMPMGPGNW